MRFSAICFHTSEGRFSYDSHRIDSNSHLIKKLRIPVRSGWSSVGKRKIVKRYVALRVKITIDFSPTGLLTE